MTAPSVGMVGGGRIARIILGGWSRCGDPVPDVLVSDADEAVLARLHADFPSISVSRENGCAAERDIVFFGLHPPAFPAALCEIKDRLRPTSVLVSLAPRWTVKRIADVLGGFDRIARVIPNAASIVGKGYNPAAYSATLNGDDRERLRALLLPLGELPEVAENSLEAYAIVAAMGPTYLWYQLYELVELGRAFGLSEAMSTRAVVRMVEGAASTMTESGLSASQVMDLIPVKPLAGLEATVKQAYAETLGALHQKLTS